MIGRSAAPLLMALFAACTAGTGGSASSPSDSVTPSPAATLRAPATARPSPTMNPALRQVIKFEGAVWGVAAYGGSIWVEESQRLFQLDGATGQQVQELPGFWPTVSGDDLWYVRDDLLVRAEAATGRERSTYRPPVLGTAVLKGVLWSASEQTHQLVAVDLAKNRIIHRLDLPSGEPKWVQPWAGAIWVVIDGSDVVLRVDPGTGKLTQSADGGFRPHSVALGFGSLWVTDHGVATVRRFGPDGRLEAVVKGPGVNVGITASSAAIWAAAPRGLMKIDPETNEVVHEIDLGIGDWYGLAWSEASLWLTSADARRLYQISPDGP